MTIDRFQSIVLRLANQMPVRYFLHNVPTGAETSIMQMYLYPGQPMMQGSELERELRELGFVLVVRDTKRPEEIWQIARSEA